MKKIIIKKGSDKIEVLQSNHPDRVDHLFLQRLIYKNPRIIILFFEIMNNTFLEQQLQEYQVDLLIDQNSLISLFPPFDLIQQK